MRFLGIDLAWCVPTDRAANETGVVGLEASGRIVAAGWTVGVSQTVEWIEREASPDTLVFVDAPLVVPNASGQRVCERHVGERYWRWKVSANSTNLSSPRLAGVELLRELTRRGWCYADGLGGPAESGRVVSECYPYTAIVGTEELGYEDERPQYKRSPRRMRRADFRPIRAAACDELIRRVAGLATCDPPLDLRSHSVTARLVDERSPTDDRPYKSREDLLDAALCAWSAALWWRWGFARSQVLGVDPSDTVRPAATIIAPTRPGQRGGWKNLKSTSSASPTDGGSSD